MWESEELFPVNERGALKSVVLGLLLMFAGTAVLYYGNMYIGDAIRRAEGYSFEHQLFAAMFMLIIHELQILLLFLAWISMGEGMSRYAGRVELAVKLLTSTAGVWLTWLSLPLMSPLLKYSFPINFYMYLMLSIIFQTLTLHVDNWMDKSAAMMLWIFSFQSLELMPTYLADGHATSPLFMGVLSSGGQVGIVSVAGTSLFFSFMAGAVVSTWVLASYSIRLSQVRRSWSREMVSAGEDEGLRQVNMQDIRNLVHDLKTPLAAIKGTAFMLRDDAKGYPGSAAEKIGIMLNATDYMERMVGEILHEDQLHRIQAERFFDRLMNHIRPFPWGKDVVTSIEPDAVLATVAMNEIRFTRALLNVLDNASRANRTAGTRGIELRVRRNAEFLEIEIADNGPGIKAAPAGKVRHSKSGWGSTGLGLAFARKVAGAHGGNLLLSERRDAPHGACVLISLPVADGSRPLQE